MYRSRSHRYMSGPALAGTSSALVALVAVTALMTAGRVAEPSAAVETRTTLPEGHRVRAVAAAVAAAARDFVGAQRIDNALVRNPFAIELAATDSVAIVPDSSDQALLPVVIRVGERLLDLPPPGC